MTILFQVSIKGNAGKTGLKHSGRIYRLVLRLSL